MSIQRGLIFAIILEFFSIYACFQLPVSNFPSTSIDPRASYNSSNDDTMVRQLVKFIWPEVKMQVEQYFRSFLLPFINQEMKVYKIYKVCVKGDLEIVHLDIGKFPPKIVCICLKLNLFKIFKQNGKIIFVQKSLHKMT